MDLPGEDIEAIDLEVPFLELDETSDPGEEFLLLGIKIVFIGEAALELAADSREFRDVKRKHLVLGSIDANAFEGSEEGGAAKGKPAGTDATDHLCLIARGDLTKVETAMELGGEDLEELAEIDAVIGGVSDRAFAAIEVITGFEQTHRKAKAIDFDARDLKSGGAFLFGQGIIP